MGETVSARLLASHPVFPTPDVRRTAAYYRDVLGFEVVEYLDAAEPPVCLYRGAVEVGATLVRLLAPTDYHNCEFVIEGIDGRWIGFGIKDAPAGSAGPVLSA